ncbi:MAG TPA: acyl transferase [Bacteroidetes bacterium]|nr:acyl transferase [Bacteroidota bacterium]
MFSENIEERIFELKSENDFLQLALEIFQVQARENNVYKEFIELQKVNVDAVNSLEKIPFLPIEFFKTHEVVTGNFSAEKIFSSSGTTSENRSNHFVKSLSLYEKSFLESFRKFFGEPSEFVFLALLPSYIERNDSSLIYMTEKLIHLSNDSRSGFYLESNSELLNTLHELNAEKKKHILLGVTFALLDFPFQKNENYLHTIIMETGGMKGRRREMIREEVHQLLKEKSGTEKIYSEYGMTELLSQAYSKGEGNFLTPPWMKILIREANDVNEILVQKQSGAINVIDLANIHSCCFIATSDLGKINSDGSFSVLGRMDNSDVRGCNLMIG